ncbi:type I methionyl aminopeptidase [Helicovermis profundi]|uniref:Methionine aminopeptidase n=1 Tax=Helicovermis profundi TaxID=3065157 RepID=A0AAU9E7K1_9FIRM|nr:type I methionyl aminopeptidase [Clostridia bacterium S502]
MIILKSENEIKLLREAGKIVAYTHEVVRDKVKPGISTFELDSIAEATIRKYNALPAFKGYGGFPGTICASINDEVVHGIPSKSRILKDGDIISVDIGSLINGYYGDSAKTFPVGNVSNEALALIEATKQSFYEGLKLCTVGNRLSDVSHRIQQYVESKGYSVVRDFVGHGVGTGLHEDPQIPNFGRPGRGPRLAKGMVLAIEPMVNIGTYSVEILDNDWTVVTADGSLSAHYEHTLAITDDEPVLLTSL